MIVYQKIASVMADMAKVGIGKDKKNSTQNFMYRGVDDVMNALAPVLSRAGLVILPRVTKRDVTERQSKSGGALFYVALEVEFDFVAAEDGSKHTVGPMIGEAMDSGDKASNKAMAIAYKYACFQAFCIPTEVVEDPDALNHEVLTPAQEIGKKFVDALKAGIDEAVVEADEFARTSLKKDRDAAWALLTKDEKNAIVAILKRASQPA